MTAPPSTVTKKPSPSLFPSGYKPSSKFSKQKPFKTVTISPVKESPKSPPPKVKPPSFGPKSPKTFSPVPVKKTRSQSVNERNAILKDNCLFSISHFLNDKKITLAEQDFDDVAERWSEWCTDIKTDLPKYIKEWDELRGSTQKHEKKSGKGIGFDGTLVFSKGDMIQYAYDLERIKKEGQVAILNMANATTPGGGYFRGSNAQEEQLCLRSDLLPRLKLAQRNGNYGKKGLRNGETLYTNNVTLLKSSVLTPVEEQYVHVVSAAATNYSGQQTQLQRDIKSGAIDLDIQSTWRNIIYAASTMGNKDLVVSVIGGGAFHNPLNNVIDGLLKALDTLIEPTNKMVIHLVVMNDKNGAKNAENTEKILKEKLETTPPTYKVKFNEDEAPAIPELDEFDLFD